MEENKIPLMELSEVKPEEPKKIRAPRKKADPIEQIIPVKPIEAPVVLTFAEKRKAELKAKIARDREENSRMVTGKFLFNECPGGRLTFVYREFPGDQLQKYDMVHGTIHTVPLGVARHLNERCAYPLYEHNLDNGKAIQGAMEGQQMYVMTKVNRTNFIPLDFTVNAGNSTGNNISQVLYTTPQLSNQLGS